MEEYKRRDPTGRYSSSVTLRDERREFVLVSIRNKEIDVKPQVGSMNRFQVAAIPAIVVALVLIAGAALSQDVSKPSVQTLISAA
jgi:hypothetical protein